MAVIAQRETGLSDISHNILPFGSLSPHELQWRARYDGLLQHGYQLRPRYRPNWKPSWIGTNIPADCCEDFARAMYLNVLDATKLDENRMVCMKVISRESNEFKIACMVSPTELTRNPNNHCVPILEVIPDPINTSNGILVMPYLHPCNDPKFETVEQLMDFIKQTLEGLCFLHSQGVAHRDCWTTNIMMDGQVLYPRGHHPVKPRRTPDYTGDSKVLKRSLHPIKYYFIDFGLSSYFEVGESPYVLGGKCADRTPPELSNEVPYNAFMLDVYILGHVYESELQAFPGVESLRSLAAAMMDKQPERRPSAEDALRMFQDIRHGLAGVESRWKRPGNRDESTTVQVVSNLTATFESWTGIKLGT
ncbi:kinase-like domain-containing protein [Cristinia sonorae]|uniref:Kinase-like domain-containing protein n=1 Tax=Cristinia sonorae TaxID=1940300 RepID=A0A8K0XSF4_9AGAR|nr:kinase-like domain-containing protein [Cristinia sonorae]